MSLFGQRRRKIKGKSQGEEDILHFNPDQRLELSPLIIFQYGGTSTEGPRVQEVTQQQQANLRGSGTKGEASVVCQVTFQLLISRTSVINFDSFFFTLITIRLKICWRCYTFSFI